MNSVQFEEMKLQFKSDFKILEKKIKKEKSSKNDFEHFFIRWKPIFEFYGYPHVTVVSSYGIGAVLFERLNKKQGVGCVE